MALYPFSFVNLAIVQMESIDDSVQKSDEGLRLPAERNQLIWRTHQRGTKV